MDPSTPETSRSYLNLGSNSKTTSFVIIEVTYIFCELHSKLILAMIIKAASPEKIDARYGINPSALLTSLFISQAKPLRIGI